MGYLYELLTKHPLNGSLTEFRLAQCCLAGKNLKLNLKTLHITVCLRTSGIPKISADCHFSAMNYFDC